MTTIVVISVVQYTYTCMIHLLEALYTTDIQCVHCTMYTAYSVQAYTWIRYHEGRHDV